MKVRRVKDDAERIWKVASEEDDQIEALEYERDTFGTLV